MRNSARGVGKSRQRTQPSRGGSPTASVQRARRLLAAKDTYDRLATLFGAIADPTRAAIVHVLLAQELSTTDLALVLGISAPAASQHLRILRDLRFVSSRREGRFVLYRLDDAHVAELVNLGVAHEAEGSPSR